MRLGANQRLGACAQPYLFTRAACMSERPVRHFLIASDFDQTLSFRDSGMVLSELLGVSGFHDRVAGLARSNSDIASFGRKLPDDSASATRP